MSEAKREAAAKALLLATEKLNKAATRCVELGMAVELNSYDTDWDHFISEITDDKNTTYLDILKISHQPDPLPTPALIVYADNYRKD